MTRPFFSKDRISHFDIFDRCAFSMPHSALLTRVQARRARSQQGRRTPPRGRPRRLARPRLALHARLRDGVPLRAGRALARRAAAAPARRPGRPRHLPAPTYRSSPWSSSLPDLLLIRKSYSKQIDHSAGLAVTSSLRWYRTWRLHKPAARIASVS